MNHVGLTRHIAQSLAADQTGMAPSLGAGLETPGRAREEHREPRWRRGLSAAPSPSRRRQLAQLLPLVCALAILGGAACGASTSPSATRTTAAPTPADLATPTPTPDPDTAIISAYEQAETTYLHLEEVPQDNAAALAELQQWFVNPALTKCHQQQLEFYVADGERVSGTSQPGVADHHLDQRRHGVTAGVRVLHHRDRVHRLWSATSRVRHRVRAGGRDAGPAGWDVARLGGWSNHV